MKLRKLLAVTAVAATMTAAFAVNAMAETTNNLVSGTDFTYDAKTGIITLTTDKQPSAAPYTMLVVASDEDDLDKTIVDTDIKQIDQADAAFTTINVGTLAEGTYEIRLGGDGDVRWGTLEVKGATPENPYANSTRLMGDVDDTVGVNLGDVTPVVYHAIGVSALTGEKLQAADVTDDGVANLGDVTPIVYYSIGVSSTVDGVATVANKTNYVEETN